MSFPVYFGPGCQFNTTVRGASVGLEAMITNLLPSGVMSQLTGPVRIPVSTISVSKRGCGVPDWNTGLVEMGTAISFESVEM